ncbi:hypothetical protein ACEPAH_5665 [Sanghuangporus vaninii]
MASRRTVIVLSSVSIYLAIDYDAYLTEEEVGPVDEDAFWNATTAGKEERIPRIIHQTWKSETLPDRWIDISQQCKDMMPDYEYMLWTDAASRDFIAREYPWFLDTFDAYTYPIQRADAIRYFVLHHYGGVYLDLDVGCRRRLDRLLVYPVVLPKTVPVGVSNDLMFAEKNHPFMAQTIHNLVTFDHDWVLNYPTVMFSTGPMFLSAQYGIWTSSHFPTPDAPSGEVRILPKPLYGKNAKIEDVPNSFFLHYYGSSWHADDAAFIGFLGKWGKGLMWIGFIFVIGGMLHLYWRRRKSKRSEGYQILLPRAHQRNGRWTVDLGLFTLTSRGWSNATPVSSCPPTPSADEDSMPMLPLSFAVRPPSPSASEASIERRTGIIGVLTRYRVWIMTTISGGYDRPRGRIGGAPTRRGWPNRGYLFFLPAIFTPNTVPVSEQGSRRSSNARSMSASASHIRHAPHVSEKNGYLDDDLEDAAVYGASSSLQPNVDGSVQVFSRPPTPGGLGGAPPPYPVATSDGGAAALRARSADGTWDSWEAH